MVHTLQLANVNISVSVDPLSVAIAVVALVVTGLTARLQNRLQTRLAAIEEERRQEERERREEERQRRQAELEAQRRAHLDARMEHPDRRYWETWELVVVSRGPAVAERVTFELRSATGADDPWLPDQGRSLATGIYPIPKLAAGEEQRFRVQLKNDAGVHVTLRWKDELGPQAVLVMTAGREVG